MDARPGKNVTDTWPETEFTETEVACPGGAIITTARSLASPAIAGRMFSRWCQENYFGYMMQHYDIDGLVTYGSEDIPGTTRIINPAWRALDNQIARLNTRLRSHQAKLGAAPPPDPDDGHKIAQHAVLLETIQALKIERDTLKPQRRATPRKIAIQDLPEADRPTQLLPLAKTLTATEFHHPETGHRFIYRLV